MASALVCAIFLVTWGTLSGHALAQAIDLSTESSNIRSVTDGAEDEILGSVVQNIQLAGINANAYHFPTFPSPPPGIDLSGVATVVNGKVRLLAGGLFSTGFLLTKAPISFYNFNRRVAGVFGTSFTYQFVNVSPNVRPGDGFTFILTASQTARGGDGGNLGYGNSGNNQSVAIEFDTVLNTGDPNSNHIGFDAFSSVRSVATTANNNPPLIDLVNGGQPVYVWIQFWPQGGPLTFKIQVFINTSPNRPATAVFEANADLGRILNAVRFSELFVGFTAATGGQSAVLDISDWAFFSAALQ